MEEHSRGRIKKWSCWITGAEGIDFPHAAQAAFIRREIFEISGDRISKEHALILTSREPGKMTAADVNRHTRGHWGIENKSHYIRDTVYREDHGQVWTGNGPQDLVLDQDGTQMRLAKDQHAVEELAAQGAEEAFTGRVHPGAWTAVRRILVPTAWMWRQRRRTG
jgi:predicted transposase YbfD/YdcC